MEASFFRALASELASRLTGRRIDKIHAPAEGVLVFTLFGASEKTNLILRPAKSAGLLFCTAEKPRNPLAAPARAMWLRKRLCGRRLLSARADWPALRLAFELSPRDMPGSGAWLVLDLREGAQLADAFPAPLEPAWPELPRVLDDDELWRAHPQLTPPLRKHLRQLAQSAPGRAQALYDRLRRGEPEGFFLAGDDAPLAWPPMADADAARRLDCAAEAARLHGERVLFTALGKAEEREQLDQAAAAARKRKRQLELLDRDEERHRALAALAIPAEALQIALSGLKRTEAVSIPLDHPEHGPQNVPLDPRLTPAQNLERLFRQAAKGRRGLEHVARRRELLLAGLPEPPRQAAPAGAHTARPAAPVLPKRYAGLAVALFQTSDGFLALRGKSSQANHEILSKAASPHDYWLHAAGGPSAHVILRRDHPGQEVPERSLIEAATLCAIKSWRKDDAKAEVLCALVKDVRKVKGAAIGSVAVDEVERVLLVRPDAEVETRLAVQPAAVPAQQPDTKPRPKHTRKK
jgi:hypothetical protein